MATDGWLALAEVLVQRISPISRNSNVEDVMIFLVVVVFARGCATCMLERMFHKVVHYLFAILLKKKGSGRLWLARAGSGSNTYIYIYIYIYICIYIYIYIYTYS